MNLFHWRMDARYPDMNLLDSVVNEFDPEVNLIDSEMN